MSRNFFLYIPEIRFITIQTISIPSYLYFVVMILNLQKKSIHLIEDGISN